MITVIVIRRWDDDSQEFKTTPADLGRDARRRNSHECRPGPSIGIATVYRNLNLLTEMGEIQKFQDRSAGFMYDGNPKKHHHFYCRYCKRYFDVSFSVEEQMIRQVEDQMGVSVEDLNISLEGCCNECKDKQEKEKERGKEQWN